MFLALYYRSGIQDAEVCVVEIDSSIATLTGAKILSFQNYHSIKFEDKGMVLWRYFDVGEGIRIPYSGVTFQSGAILKKPFSKTQQFEKTNTSKKGKERLDRKLYNLFYCHELDCCEVFHDKKIYENHLIKGIHNFIGKSVIVSSEDKVQKTFAARMKLISLPKSLGVCSIDTINVKESVTMTEICERNHLMQVFQNPGWAIPVHSTFWYNARQKQLVYKYSIEGEETGKK